MGYYEDLRKKQRETGEYQTRDGGKVTTTPKTTGSGGNVVSNASANLGAGKTETPKTTGGNIVSSASANLGAGRTGTGKNPAKTNNVTIDVIDRINAYSVPSFTKKNPNTGASGYDWQSAVKAATNKAKTQQDNKAIMTRYGGTVNYTPYLNEEEETGTTELVSTTYGAPVSTSIKLSGPSASETFGSYINDNGNNRLNKSLFELLGGKTPAAKRADYSGLEAAKTYEPKKQTWRDTSLFELLTGKKNKNNSTQNAAETVVENPAGKENNGLNKSLFELLGGNAPTGKQADYSGLEAAKTYEATPQAWRDTSLYELLGGNAPTSKQADYSGLENAKTYEAKPQAWRDTSLYELLGGNASTGKQADYSGLEAAKTYEAKPQAWRDTSIYELLGGTIPTEKQADYSGLEAAKTYEPKPQAWRDTPIYDLLTEPRTNNKKKYESVDGASAAVSSYNPYRTKDNAIVASPGAANLVGLSSANLDQRVFNDVGGKEEIVEETEDVFDYGSTGAYDDSEAYAGGVPAGFTMQPRDDMYSRDTAMWLLEKYGMTEEDLRGIPVEAIYLGDHRYELPYYLKYDDDHIIYRGSTPITIGELKQELTNGAYIPGKGITGSTNSTAQAASYGKENPNTGADPYADELEAETDEETAYNNYMQAAIDAILGQKSNVDREASDAKQQAYANYVRSKLGMGEMTTGMATGMADSLLVQNDMAFQNNMNDIERDRLDAYADIDSQAAQIEAEGQLQLAQMAEERRREAEDRAWQERQWAYQLEQDRIRNSGGDNNQEDAEPIMLTAKDYVDTNYYRTDFANMTFENIEKELRELKESGVISQEEYDKAIRYYRGEIKLDQL